jgi:hypothetical protein
MQIIIKQYLGFAFIEKQHTHENTGELVTSSGWSNCPLEASRYPSTKSAKVAIWRWIRKRRKNGEPSRAFGRTKYDVTYYTIG